MIVMIRVRQIKLEVGNTDKLLYYIAKKLKVEKSEIISYKIFKESIDARHKDKILYIYEVDVNVKNEKKVLAYNNNDIFKTPDLDYKLPVCKRKKSVVIVGSGPAGLFAAYILSLANFQPIVIERGKSVDQRVLDVNKFFQTGILNLESNVQFGEGGAGTFSDGKLYTQIKDKENRMRKVLETFVECGACEDIMYSYKPHIGTDLLRDVIKNLRNKIIELGGQFLYNTKLTDLVIKDQKIIGIQVNNQNIINCDRLILAIGNSSRDTFRMLYKNNIKMESKPLAIGVRIQHPQRLIDLSQYGDKYNLDKATYKLTYTTKMKRGVYSFCMCPGGYVINASSNIGQLVINGMSNHNRDSMNANSAIVVTVNKNDYGPHPLDGIKYQEQIESMAYKINNGKIPIQLYKDFKNNIKSNKFGSVKPVFKGDYEFANINDILPIYITNSIKEAIDVFDKKIKGFGMDDAIIAGVETRTSSPVRINRDDNFQTNIKGIYPCGEGAGYAGGITSSAIDGMKVAEAIIKD